MIRVILLYITIMYEYPYAYHQWFQRTPNKNAAAALVAAVVFWVMFARLMSFQLLITGYTFIRWTQYDLL